MFHTILVYVSIEGDYSGTDKSEIKKITQNEKIWYIFHHCVHEGFVHTHDTLPTLSDHLLGPVANSLVAYLLVPAPVGIVFDV